MTIARMYAEALQQAQASHKTPAELLQNLRATLARRGHAGLFVRIFFEYQKLVLKEERSNAAHAPTKEQERTRVLLQLYRTLTA